ncbi:hypothetical protein BGZ80_007232 [Entomortierella chlamydospora]|uniref:Uncharacterized protein n=1 Tax=Entomortierella chlamydospora TaxID=101097 RepID=A0A9P6MYJ2_9FUNG|nr:hypothetical protein BGZ79_010275 [Entomortierella chlamydospora]KAG0018377.1 hypothetical protein BGZ80_007232 [Entomortierella chlamydospora]
MTQSTTTSNTTSSGKARRLSLIRLFNGKSKNGSAIEPIESSDSPIPDVPAVPVHYRHSMGPTTDFQNQMMRERRKSIAAVTDATGRSVSLDLKHPVEMNDKMRQFDELLQKRRSSTIRISLTPSLLQE